MVTVDYLKGRAGRTVQSHFERVLDKIARGDRDPLADDRLPDAEALALLREQQEDGYGSP